MRFDLNLGVKNKNPLPQKRFEENQDPLPDEESHGLVGYTARIMQKTTTKNGLLLAVLG